MTVAGQSVIMTTDCPAGSYRDLKVWQMARDLAIEVGNLCETGGLSRSHVLADQMQRSSISVPSNIAEGNDRQSNRDTLRFLIISRGSLAELQTQLDIALGRRLISAEQHARLEVICGEIGRMLSGLIKFRRQREGGGAGIRGDFRG